MRKAALLILAGALGSVVAAGAPAAGSAEPTGAAWFNVRGKVTRVLDGDTLRARIGPKVERVRLIGIDAPEAGGCYAPNATAALRRLALNKTVRLVGDRTQTRRDVYGRLLAYVALPDGVDAGRRLLAGGYATLYETTRPFARQRSYEATADAAERANAGLHDVCATVGQPPLPIAPPISTTTTPAPPSSNCAPSYPDVCIPPPPPDLDCAQVPHRRFRVVHNVASPDPHRFDGDRDGVGCEG